MIISKERLAGVQELISILEAEYYDSGVEEVEKQLEELYDIEKAMKDSINKSNMKVAA